MKLYIIRHGETSWNKAKKLQGRKDIMLDADGIRLAAESIDSGKALKVLEKMVALSN